MATWHICHRLDSRLSKPVSAVIRSTLSNFRVNYSCSYAQHTDEKLLRRSLSLLCLLLKEAVKSSSHRRPFGIPSITADDEEATAVKKTEWRFIEEDGDKYLLLPSLSPSLPPPTLRQAKRDPHMDTLPSRCMESTHDGDGRGLTASPRWVPSRGGGRPPVPRY